jgi:hypothetical protein
MKKIMLILGLFAFAIAVKAQQPQSTVSQSKPVVDKKAPQITFEQTTIDYGTIEQYSDGNRIFKFKNTGKSPLVITNVSSSCGCLVPSWSKDPILPGKKGEIKAHYDTGRLGVFNKTLTVMSNAATSTVILEIKGDVKPAGTQAPAQPVAR